MFIVGSVRFYSIAMTLNRLWNWTIKISSRNRTGCQSI